MAVLSVDAWGITLWGQEIGPSTDFEYLLGGEHKAPARVLDVGQIDLPRKSRSLVAEARPPAGNGRSSPVPRAWQS